MLRCDYLSKLKSLSRRLTLISVSCSFGTFIKVANALIKSVLLTLPSKSISKDLKTSSGVSSRSLCYIRSLLNQLRIFYMTSYCQAKESSTTTASSILYCGISLCVIKLVLTGFTLRKWMNWASLTMPMWLVSMILNIFSSVG